MNSIKSQALDVVVALAICITVMSCKLTETSPAPKNSATQKNSPSTSSTISSTTKLSITGRVTSCRTDDGLSCFMQVNMPANQVDDLKLSCLKTLNGSYAESVCDLSIYTHACEKTITDDSGLKVGSIDTYKVTEQSEIDTLKSDCEDNFGTFIRLK